jgi:hypothetical protein
MHVRRVVLVVGIALLLALPLAGCANPGSMPRLHANVTVGPKAHRAVIRITASGRLGGAFSGIVLSYPDGHRRILGSGFWGRSDVGYWAIDGLPSGVYTCTAYAVPAKAKDDLIEHGLRTNRPFPVGEMVKENVAASATFVIP